MKEFKNIIQIDENENHFPFFVEVAVTIGNVVVDIEYTGFFSISEAKTFIQKNPNLLYVKM